MASQGLWVWGLGVEGGGFRVFEGQGLNRVAVKELEISFCNKETPFICCIPILF